MSILDKYNLSEEQRDRVMTKVASTISELQKTDTLEKVAVDWHSPLAQTGLALAATAVGTGISMGVPKLVDAIRAASIRRNKDEYLKAMKDAHPELKNVSQRDLDLAYNSMAMHSPGVIKDPLMGGQVMKEITGRAMRWDLNQYSTLNRTAGGGLADYEHQALQQFGKGVGNLTNVYYDASAKADQAKRDQDRVNLSEKVHTYNVTRDASSSKLDEEKFNFQRTSANRQYLQQKKQIENQEQRDKEQQRQFSRNFGANQADRRFSQDMANKNYELSEKNYRLNRTNQHYNIGGTVESHGERFNKATNAHNEAFQRAEGELKFQIKNQKDVNALAHNQSYHKALGQSEAELKNNDRIMRQAYDKSFYGQAGKVDAPFNYVDQQGYQVNDPGSYGTNRP